MMRRVEKNANKNWIPEETELFKPHNIFQPLPPKSENRVHYICETILRDESDLQYDIEHQYFFLLRFSLEGRFTEQEILNAALFSSLDRPGACPLFNEDGEIDGYQWGKIIVKYENISLISREEYATIAKYLPDNTIQAMANVRKVIGNV